VVTICTAQWSLYVPHSGHYMYRTVVTTCTAQWSLYVPHSGHCMYHQFNIQQFYVLPTQLYLCVLCGSENKQRLFPYTTLTDWFLLPRRSVLTARYGMGIYVKFILFSLTTFLTKTAEFEGSWVIFWPCLIECCMRNGGEIHVQLLTTTVS